MTKKTFKRHRKLILPELQLRLVGTFLGLLCLGLIFQFVLFATAVSELASSLDSSGELLERAQWTLVGTALKSFAIVLPLTLLVGVVHTNKIAGPIFRLGRYLDEFAQGQQPERVRLRDGDYLQGFARKVNEATQPSADAEAGSGGDADTEDVRQAA